MMNLEQARQSFLQESAELLEEMESILLDAEADNITAEQLGALFRAMHTIKGSAGLFGLEDIVHFTHQVEDLLDQLRDGSCSWMPNWMACCCAAMTTSRRSWLRWMAAFRPLAKTGQHTGRYRRGDAALQ
jgi:chemotaxis protein histidine kinase CheA